ncbi:hypothetical protein [Kitasatospora sp. NPDC004272]
MNQAEQWHLTALRHFLQLYGEAFHRFVAQSATPVTNIYDLLAGWTIVALSTLLMILLASTGLGRPAAPST